MAAGKNRAERSRDRMMGEIAEGGSADDAIDLSRESILARGCDPQMAIRASKMLPPHLGFAELVSCTNDDDFVTKLKERAWSVVFFAPGACRYDAAGMQIPGGRSDTRGWALEQYRALVRTHQGADILIVETTDEREIIPRLRAALCAAAARNGGARD